MEKKTQPSPHHSRTLRYPFVPPRSAQPPPPSSARAPPPSSTPAPPLTPAPAPPQPTLTHAHTHTHSSVGGGGSGRRGDGISRAEVAEAAAGPGRSRGGAEAEQGRSRGGAEAEQGRSKFEGVAAATKQEQASATEQNLASVEEMDNVESTGASGSNTKVASGSTTKGVVHWTNGMSTMMLGFLTDLVASGRRTSTGFKVCHHNQCIQVLNEHFKLSLTHEQCSNHLKKWRKIWGRLIQLKNLSGALWDEDTCTISLSDEHYAGHCNNNKSDIPLLNTPIEHYRAMETIFGSSVATGKFAKSGNDPLSIDIEDDGEVNTSPNVGESAAKAPPKKKAKLVHLEDDPLVTTLKEGFKMMAEALVKSGGDDDDIPDGLFDALKELNGFDDEHIAHYYAHLVDSPKIAKAFMTLSKQNKLVWVGRYMEKVFGVIYNLN